MSASQRPGKNSPDATDAPPDDQPTLDTFADAHGTTDTIERPIAITEPADDAWGFPTDGVAIAIPEQFIAECQHEDCQPAVEWRDCDQCGQPTFGAVEGIPLAVCADCTVVSGDG